MTAAVGRILVVDDSRLNRLKLSMSLREQGHIVAEAADGQPALDRLRAEPFDVVLLDILMPEMDGYQVLSILKADHALRDIPVIVISAVDDMASVVRCIELGAADYLPKTFDPALLKARLNAVLAAKRLRDLEREYLEQVGYVIGAAGAVESDRFEPGSLDHVAAREDALGQLARVFQRMAVEVRLRAERLKQQVQALRIEIDQSRQARKVAEITTSDYFQRLRGQADELRKIIDE